MKTKRSGNSQAKPVRRIRATNLGAQLRHRGAGNPPSSSPDSAPSNCYPGLVADFRAVWRRIFVGIELHEATNLVVKADGDLAPLEGHRLLCVGGIPLVLEVTGPRRNTIGEASEHLAGGSEVDGLVVLEWANALAAIVLKTKPDQYVSCVFTKEKADRTRSELPKEQTVTYQLKVRNFFERADGNGPVRPVIAEEVAAPGELTQGLCSPWQSDFRECACYYWAASRPDYVNVVPDAREGSLGHNWLAKNRTGPPDYILDPGGSDDKRLLTEKDVLNAWERVLRFVIAGNDSKSE